MLTVLSTTNERFDQRYALKRLGYDTIRIAGMVPEGYTIDADDIFRTGHQNRVQIKESN